MAMSGRIPKAHLLRERSLLFLQGLKPLLSRRRVARLEVVVRLGAAEEGTVFFDPWELLEHVAHGSLGVVAAVLVLLQPGC